MVLAARLDDLCEEERGRRRERDLRIAQEARLSVRDLVARKAASQEA